MPENRIKRKELWATLGNVKQEDWLRLAEQHSLRMTQPDKKGTSHIAIRKPDPDIPDWDIRGLIVTIHPHLFKQANQKIFKKFLEYGLSEDDIWRGLGRL